MFSNSWKFAIWLLLGLSAIVQGAFPTSIAELSENDTLDTVRRVKSEEIRRYMNEAADPCEDFYEFTCANYDQYHKQNVSSTPLYEVPSVMKRKMQSFLETDDINDSTMEIVVKNFYRSCKNITEYFEDNKHSVKSILNDLGSAPFIEGDYWQEHEFDWSKTVAKIAHTTGITILLDVAVAMDFADSSSNAIFVGEPTFAVKQKALYTDNVFLKYQKYNTAYKLELLFDVDKSLAIQLAAEIVDFEIALVHGMVDKTLGLKSSEVFEVTDIDDVQRKYLPELNVKKLITDSLNLNPAKIYVDHKYVQNALNVIKRTSQRTVANYIFFRYFEKFTPMQECFSYTQKYFDKFLQNIMYRKYSTPQMESELFSFWREMKKAFRDILYSPKLDWMQKETKKYALEKLKVMKLNLVSYKDYDFTEELNQLDLNDYNYAENMKTLFTLRGNQARARYYERPKSKDIDNVSPSNSPFFDTQVNMIYISMTHLQPYYLWSSLYPNAYNFATMGSLIGHEILHSFDNMGREYDAEGNERDWWDFYSAEEFKKRTQCFVNQYEKYIFEGQPLGAKPSQSENIADGGGIHLAYDAYLNWYAKQSAQQKNAEYMPDLNYTHKQLFFISYAQLWCEAVGHFSVATERSDTHTPMKLRAVGALANLEEFGKVFNCARGSHMRPVNACELY